MGRYLAYRLLSAVPILLVVSLVSFLIIFLVPGDPASEIAGQLLRQHVVDDQQVAGQAINRLDLHERSRRGSPEQPVRVPRPHELNIAERVRRGRMQ